MLKGTCHCGAVQIAVARKPRRFTSCNCSICRRYSTLWAYYDRTKSPACSCAMISASGSPIAGLSQMKCGLRIVESPAQRRYRLLHRKHDGAIPMKTVLITGCSSGYGLETARHFHSRGWKVIATMRTPRTDVLPRSERLVLRTRSA